MTEDPTPPADADCSVGYGKPPKHKRFHKGKSGNPAGRPRGAKNKPKIASRTLNDMLRRELGRDVEIRGMEGAEVLSIAQAATRALGVQAVKGNVRAQQHVIALQRDLDSHDAAQQTMHDEALIALRDRQLAKRIRYRELGLPEQDIIPDPDHIMRDRATGNMIIRGPADRHQKAEWERMSGFRDALQFEVERSRRKLIRLSQSHVLEREDLTESIETHEYWVTFYNLRLMTVFSLSASQVSDDPHEQIVLEQRLREGRWPEPPADVRRGLRRDELEALRRGEIRIDAIAQDEKLRKFGFPALKFAPVAHLASDLEQTKRRGKDTASSPTPAKAKNDNVLSSVERTEKSWIDGFSLLSRLPSDIHADLEAASTIMSVPAGALVFATDQSAETVLVILAGTVRVQRLPGNGRTLPAFHLGRGELCALALSSEMALEDYGTDGIAVTDVSAAAIPRPVFDDVFTRSPDFRMFVFEL